MARLAVFDIDGTLCDSNAVDDACFVTAVSEFLNVDPTLIDWSSAPHITDSGLLKWLCEKHGRSVTESEAECVASRFVDLLRDQASTAPALFQPIGGAPEALAALAELGWDVALATGGWRRSAQLKLFQIGIDSDEIVLATANDANTRAEIVATAIERAQAHYGKSYSRVVSIGDAPWDVRTAAGLGLPFIGVAHSEGADRLREAGASAVLHDLSDMSALSAALDGATVPAAAILSASA